MQTGPEFEIEKAHARAVSIVFLVEIYSAGIQILYPCGFLFLFMTYFSHKFYCIKYYRRNYSQNGAITDSSIKFVLLGLILHILIGILMLTDNKFEKTFPQENIIED